MLRVVILASLLGLLGAAPLSAEEPAAQESVLVGRPDAPISPLPGTVLPAPAPAASATESVLTATPAWQTAWGLVALRFIPEGPKTAPNGQLYHPNFSLDLNFNFWIWRSQRVYMFSDVRLWGERGENGVTNGNDGALGTSKRQFDLDGGVAWNYAGHWEARAFGYTYNNLNRGSNLLTPVGFADGFGMENRYYLSSMYDRLGETGFDVARATFLSIGYYPSKNMVGNDGHSFRPGLLLRAYLTYDLWDWPCYLYGDFQYIGERSFQSRLFLFDVGAAARPFRAWQQWEFRLGVENTADFHVHDVQNLWYGAIRFIY